MIRFVHHNDGRVLTIEIGDTSYTPEEIKAALDKVLEQHAMLLRCLEERQQLANEVVALSRALIDYENWIKYVLEEGVPPVLPAAFGQWRRPA